MRPVIYVLSFIAVLGLGFWAYREHYETRDVLRELSGLQNEIADLRERVQTLERIVTSPKDDLKRQFDDLG